MTVIFVRQDPAPIQEVGRRFPGEQVHPQEAAVGLGVPLAAAQRRSVRRLGQVRDDPRRGQLLGHVPPAGAPLQSEMHVVLTGEAGQPGPQVLPVGRHHPAPVHLAGERVQPTSQADSP